MLILISSVRDKVAASSLVHALPTLSVNSALLPPEVALILVEVVPLAETIPDLTAANSTILTPIMIAKMLMLKATPDFPVYKPSVEVRIASASLVLSLPLAKLVPKPLSASNILAVVLVVVPNYLSRLVASLSFVLPRELRLLVVMLVLSTALILRLSVALSDRRFAPEDVWVEALALMDNVFAETDTRELIAL